MTEIQKSINEAKSKKTGVAGLLENALRSFKNTLHIIIVIPLYIFVSAILGIALIPGLQLLKFLYHWTQVMDNLTQLFLLGTGIVLFFFISGFSAMFIVPLVNFLFVGRLKEWRGPYYSLEAIKWYAHNGLLYLLRYSFLEYVTPSPFLNWFYKAMGMRLGEGAVINSTHISDPSLITLGERVTIGGSATIVAHYGQSGYLVLAPVIIGEGVTIGLKCTIMGGVKIGKNSKILPNSVLLPKTEVPENETWGGVPAKKIDLRSLTEKPLSSVK